MSDTKVSFVRNAEWACKFLSEPEVAEIASNFHKSRKNVPGVLSLDEKRKKHLQDEYNQALSEATNVRAIRQTLVDEHTKRLYQLHGDERLLMMPKKPPPEPPARGIMSYLLDNSFGAGSMSSVADKQMQSTIRQRKQLNLIKTYDGPDKANGGKMTIGGCPLVKALVPHNAQFDQPGAHDHTTLTEEKKFDSLSNFLRSDSKLADKYGMSKNSMQKSLDRMRGDEQLLGAMRKMHRRVASLSQRSREPTTAH